MYADLVGDVVSKVLSDGVVVPYASVERLLELKDGTGRPKDELDRVVLSKIARGLREREAVNLAGMEGGAAEERPSGPEQGEWPSSR